MFPCLCGILIQCAHSSLCHVTIRGRQLHRESIDIASSDPMARHTPKIRGETIGSSLEPISPRWGIAPIVSPDGPLTAQCSLLDGQGRLAQWHASRHCGFPGYPADSLPGMEEQDRGQLGIPTDTPCHQARLVPGLAEAGPLPSLTRTNGVIRVGIKHLILFFSKWKTIVLSFAGIGVCAEGGLHSHVADPVAPVRHA
jgi:hypothetical protein